VRPCAVDFEVQLETRRSYRHKTPGGWWQAGQLNLDPRSMTPRMEVARVICTAWVRQFIVLFQSYIRSLVEGVKKTKTVVDTPAAIVFIGVLFGARSASAPDAGSALTETSCFNVLG
jgi:hypothetical protein